MGIRSIERISCTLTWATSGVTVASGQCPNSASGWIQHLAYVMTSTCADVSGTISCVDGTTGKTYYTGTTNELNHGASGGLSAQNLPMLGGESWFVVTFNGIPGCAAGVSATPLTSTVDFYYSP